MTIQRLLVRTTSFILLCVLFTQTAFSQTKTITGKITDDKGVPIQGATVAVKGSKAGVSTGTDGSFTLSVPTTATTIMVSSVGFASQEVSIAGQTFVTVSLVNSSQGLNEVVVVGYGTARKKDLTGSVSAVTAKDFNKGIVAAPDQLLTGKVAGLEVTVNSGQPGAATTVKIRGNNSIRGGTTPLYVIDGIPLDGRAPRPVLYQNPTTTGASGLGNLPDADPLIYINPQDIQSIDVLKDASASAIYGSRGANGVILVTTKKGVAGQTRLEGSITVADQGLMKQPDLLDAAQYRSELKVYGQGSDSNQTVTPFKDLLQHKLSTNYNLALSGGTENGKYRISFLASDQQGIIKKSSLEKYIANANGQFRFWDKRISLDFNLTASNYTEYLAPISNDAGSTGNLISLAMNWNPTLRLVNPDGSYNQANPSKQVNPLALQDYYTDINNVTATLGNISLGFKITNDLEYKLLYGINYGVGNRDNQLLGLIGQTGGNADGKGQAFVASAKLFSQTLDHTLNYNHQFSDAFTLNAVAGYEYWTTSWRNQSDYVYGFDYNVPGGPRLNIPYYNNMQDGLLNNFRTTTIVDPSVELQSYFARAVMNFYDKYLITGTFRADGSSRFGPANKYAYFPSVAAAWNISNESFMKNNTVFDNLKLRLGWGETGSQDGIPAGATKDLSWYTGSNGNVGLINFKYDTLKWEKVTAEDLGIDFSILHGRVYGSIDGFYKKTTHVLFFSPAIQPSSNPNGGQWKNLPDAAYITNKGIEASIGVAIIDKDDFHWNVNVNFEYVRNKFVYPAIGNSPLYLTGSITGQGVSSAFSEAIANNQPVDVFYLRKFTGFDQNGIATVQSQASSYQGDPNPHVILGLNTDLGYKKWSLTINTHGAFGNKIYNNTATSVLNLGNIANGKNIAASLIGTKESLANPVSASTRFLESGNYLKLGNATINYNIGKIANIVKNANAFVTGSNLFEITKYHGFDAEVNTDHNNNGVPSLGVDYIGYPSVRTFLVGINFTL
ncbi:MAG TPA: SusC/RagA family TonB-linked outer membrane protein [Puia sp.]|nr:SusC/RagA family TonB-linked outer membrane protein [Puia sp.]